ncbi:nuclear receptor-binding protein [Lingula anatina]|uniref:Nuclear receptor-binding protein homolog n=1 Tax=Lingula anatina TaxID=7574 RepID=A0A1S3H926_LINAN|nr:nuclear receptor-binding protein [Lingula anatina]|eukprot:XP_013382590.1 nuclear receptor-binding protein [Lingula anatina]
MSSKGSGESEKRSQHDSGDETEEDESDVLEESPCGRWQKRREEVQQRDVPGIDNAFLAMDTEEGVEVVWNEVEFSEKKNFKNQQEKIKQVFDNLIQLEHANIVKFHKYWTDTKTDKPRVIFITEYMSSGSLKQFLKRTKKNNRTIKAWKRWCTQILSALSYLHSCDPPIIHGNLTCDTIFIQHNGLIKIGSVAPDAIHNHVKTCREEQKNMHYIAPEYGTNAPVTAAVDIYSFGMCALQMAAVPIQGNGDTANYSREAIQKTIESLENPLQRDFISKCLLENPKDRPSTRDLLFHPILVDVYSLKLLAAHVCCANSRILSETWMDGYRPQLEPNHVVAEIFTKKEPVAWSVSQLPSEVTEIEKFLEDVRSGIYPLTIFEMQYPPISRARAISPEMAESVKSDTPEPADVESRKVISMSAVVKKMENGEGLHLTLQLRMDDKMNRQLNCEFTDEEETPFILAEELVHYGFINEEDRHRIATLIGNSVKNCHSSSSPQPLIPVLQNMAQVDSSSPSSAPQGHVPPVS